MSEDNHQEKSPATKRRETLEEFSKRVGLKYIKGEKGGQEFSPFHGGNLLDKKPKKTCKG